MMLLLLVLLVACVLDGDDDALIIPLDVYIDVAAYKRRSFSMISGKFVDFRCKK